MSCCGRRCAAERLRLGSLWQHLDLVFPSDVGGFLDQDRVYRVFTRICQRAGVPKIRVYDLRHTSATLLLANGVDLKTVSARLGHTDGSLVLKSCTVGSEDSRSSTEAAAVILFLSPEGETLSRGTSGFG